LPCQLGEQHQRHARGVAAGLNGVELYSQCNRYTRHANVSCSGSMEMFIGSGRRRCRRNQITSYLGSLDTQISTTCPGFCTHSSLNSHNASKKIDVRDGVHECIWSGDH
jgi:hypothetical protein